MSPPFSGLLGGGRVFTLTVALAAIQLSSTASAHDPPRAHKITASERLTPCDLSPKGTFQEPCSVALEIN